MHSLPNRPRRPVNGRSAANLAGPSKGVASAMTILETDRLLLRRLSVEDAEFIRELLNQPSFLRYIGDKGVRAIDDARKYILNGPMDSYERIGFGLYLTELKGDGVPIGICGLLKREVLEDVEIGFAFLPEFWTNGYACESAAAVMAYGKSAFGLSRIVAVVSSDNYASFKVLEKIGLNFERMIKLSDDSQEIKLFAWDHHDRAHGGGRFVGSPARSSSRA